MGWLTESTMTPNVIVAVSMKLGTMTTPEEKIMLS
jgi:hypothetical protein